MEQALAERVTTPVVVHPECDVLEPWREVCTLLERSCSDDVTEYGAVRVMCILRSARNRCDRVVKEV